MGAAVLFGAILAIGEVRRTSASTERRSLSTTAHFTSVKVIRILRNSEGDVAHSDAIADAATALKLASYFHGLGGGERSGVAGGWRAGWSLVFFNEKGKVAALTMDAAMQHWSEGLGDWNVDPALPGIIRDILAKQNNPTTTEQ